MTVQERFLYGLLLILLVGLVITGFLVQGWDSAWAGLLTIQGHSARLISDFSAIGGPGAALVNGALVGLVGLGLVRLVGVRLSGPTFAAIFTMLGFGLFGKTPFNILPIVLGVFLASLVAKRSFKEYILIALFGTALGPLSTAVAVEIGLELGWALPWALSAGLGLAVAVGFFLPSLALSMLHLHQGYNLYNMGLTCGFLGLFASSFLRATGTGLPIHVVWNKEFSWVLFLVVPLISLIFLLSGLWLHGKKALKDFWEIQKFSGRLPTDFVDGTSLAGALINVGALGLLSAGYVWAVGGDFNGPVLGGLFTIMGFGAFGKHLRNVWPVVAGVVLSTLFFGKSLTAPGPLLGALFGTTLAPLAGEFGIIVGLVAGFIHLFMVEQTAAWHGGLDLYNNGFAGGLTAALLVAVIQWIRTNRPDR